MPDHDIIPPLRQKLLQGVRALPVLPLLPPPPLSQLIIAFSKIGFGCYEQTILSRQLIGGPFAGETFLKKNKLYISTKKEETEELRRNFRFYL